ncbi:hypothetical protein [Corynebacterium sp. AOP40-4SA-5]|uniref:hypothetical protein n=2 Tax=Corynebacterium TaxID=1716 RepID=UPI00403374AB
MALIRGLPEGSALHREMNDGHVWTMDHSLMWHVAYLLQRVETVLGAQGVKKKPTMPKKQATPWDEDGKTKRTGRVDAGDEQAAVNYLMGLRKKT